MMIRRVLTAFLLAAALPAVAADRGAALSPESARRRDAIEHYLRARLLAIDSQFEESLKEFRKAIELDPKDGSLRRDYAEALRDLSVLPEAEQQARKAVELAPENPGAHRILGQVLLANARDRAGVEAAARELKVANDALPGDPVGAIAYAQALLRLDKAEEAATILERVLDKARGPAVALLYGEALEKSGRLGEAEEHYEMLLKMDPDSTAAALGLLRTFERGRKYEKAVPLLEEFLKTRPSLGLKVEYASLLVRARRYDDARRTLDEILKADPGNRDALRQYGTLLAETREFEKADEMLKKLEAVDPDDPEVPFRRATVLLEAHKVPEAEAVLVKLREKLVAKGRSESELAQVDGQLGYAAYLRKDYETTKRRVTPHLNASDDGLNDQSYNLLLQVARDADKPADGLVVAEAALKVQPKNPLVRSAKGEFTWRTGKKDEGTKLLDALASEGRVGALAASQAWQRVEQFEKAAEVARRGLESAPNDPDLLFVLGASLERAKRVPEAVAAFEKLLQVNQDHAAGLNYLGYLWADRGENLPRALQLIQKAVALEPTNGAYLDSLGWVYFRLDRLEEAEENLRAARALNPDDSAIEEHLGDLYERKGQLAKARASWRHALTLKPDDPGKLEEKLRRTDGAVSAAEK